MRVIITGGSGLIGRALATKFARDGDEVIIISRSPERVTGLPAGVSAKRWDGRTGEGWAFLVDSADAIINLAGENISSGHWTTERKKLILESRLNAGRAVVQAVEAATNKPKETAEKVPSVFEKWGLRGTFERKSVLISPQERRNFGEENTFSALS